MSVLTTAFFNWWESSWKIENIQKRCLRLKLDDYESDYEALIKKKGSSIMQIKRLRVLVTKIFQTLNDINPSYMKNIFVSEANAQVTLKLGMKNVLATTTRVILSISYYIVYYIKYIKLCSILY